MKKQDYIPALRFDWLTNIFDPFIQWTMPEKELRNALITALNPEEDDKLLDFGKVNSKLLRAMFLPWQALDGIANTRDNIQGKIPEFMEQTDFREVSESNRTFSIFGIINFYKGIK